MLSGQKSFDFKNFIKKLNKPLVELGHFKDLHKIKNRSQTFSK